LPQEYGGELPTLTELEGIYSSKITSTNSFFLNIIMKNEHSATTEHHLSMTNWVTLSGNFFSLVFKRP
jgi:hypothetical protein